MEDDHYALLGVDPEVDRRTLRAAYLARMRLHHPDHRPGDPGDTARRLNAAYETLNDPVRRAAYDRTRRARITRRAVTAGSGDRVDVRAPRGARTVANPAYSHDHERYYRQVSSSLWRLGMAIFLVGLIGLAVLSG